jgi:hypothetical protein
VTLGFECEMGRICSKISVIGKISYWKSVCYLVCFTSFNFRGELDEIVPTVLHIELQNLIPSAKIVIHKEYSHSIPIENHQLVADEIHAFFSSIPADSDYNSGSDRKENVKRGWFDLLK